MNNGYPLAGYGAMIRDQTRMDAYVEAMRRVIGQDSVVVDLGAGPGIIALIACQLGAKEVIAIEPDSSIRLLRRLSEANGFSTRITVVEAMSTETDLKRVADLVVSDLRSTLPLFASHLPSIVDARNRLLKPGGTLIPNGDRIYAAAVEAPVQYERISDPWRNNRYGLDLNLVAKIESNRIEKCYLNESALISQPQVAFDLDYSNIVAGSMQKQISSTIEREATLHGFALWFDSTLLPGIELSNHPSRLRLIYGQAFLPLDRPVKLHKDARFQLDLSAHWLGGQYVWQWKGRIEDKGIKPTEFDQSSFKTKLAFKAFNK